MAEADGTFDWPSVDFVTDRNGLRKLLRWISGTASKDFRIDMQLAGDRTVLFNRWEVRTREQMSGYTYGFNFETASTRPASGCERSTGHHRIVRYVRYSILCVCSKADTLCSQDLNGLQMVVRFEVDAYIPSASTLKPRPAQAATTLDDLIGALSGVNLRTPNTESPAKSIVRGSAGATKITVVTGGAYVPQSAIIEMTTRATHRESEYDWKESYPQLFLSQTQHHFLAVHQRGHFVRVNKRKLQSSELDSVNTLIQSDLKKLRRVLDIIKYIVIKHGEQGRLSLVCKGGVLKIFQRASQVSCLPEEMLGLFTNTAVPGSFSTGKKP
jgi:hypothetical protein